MAKHTDANTCKLRTNVQKKGEGPESVAGKSGRTNLPLEESTRKNGYKYSGLRTCVDSVYSKYLHIASSQTQRDKREKAEHEGKRKYTC